MADRRNPTWLEEPRLLKAVADRVEQEHASGQAEDKAYLRAYYDRPVINADYTRPYRELAVFDSLKERYGGNLTREVIDAAGAILCRPLVSEVLPKGTDDFELEMGCKEASRLIDGVFDNCDFLSIAKRSMKDGSICRVGLVKGLVDKESEEIRFVRMNPLHSYWVDDGTDNPRTFIEVTPVSKDFLCAQYPKHAAKIRDMPTWSPPTVVGVDLPGTRRNKDGATVKVVEAWARALGPNTPGAHQIMVGDIVLEREPWPHEIAPVFGFKWQEDHSGFGGVSLARIVTRYDSANRRLLRMIYAALQGAQPRVVAHEDTEIDGLTDVEFEILRYSGNGPPPQIVAPRVVTPDLIEQIERNYVRAYAEGGVNQNMATGSAPARYTSGAAQREFVDIANTRLLDAQHQWEKLWRTAAMVVVILAQHARKAHVRVKGANYYKSVTWPKLSKDKMRISFGLSSGLGLTPAARLDDLERLQGMGLADVADVARQVELPNTRDLADRLNAPRDLVMQQIDMALNQGIPVIPSAIQGEQLQAIIKIGGEEYQKALMRGNRPRKNMELLRRLIKAAAARLKPPPAPAVPAAAQGAPAGGGGAPGGGAPVDGAPPPTSDQGAPAPVPPESVPPAANAVLPPAEEIPAPSALSAPVGGI